MFCSDGFIEDYIPNDRVSKRPFGDHSPRAKHRLRYRRLPFAQCPRARSRVGPEFLKGILHADARRAVTATPLEATNARAQRISIAVGLEDAMSARTSKAMA
jgi:hypothetical protein